MQISLLKELVPSGLFRQVVFKGRSDSTFVSAKSIDPDEVALERAISSGSMLFASLLLSLVKHTLQ